jgi:hypothetical protein
MTELDDWQSDWLYQLIFREAAQQTSINRQSTRVRSDAASALARKLQRMNPDDAKLKALLAAAREQSDRDKPWQFALIVESEPTSQLREESAPQRAWIQDANDLRTITIDEVERQMKRIRERLYPFVLVSFAISEDRQYVDLSVRHADTAAFGARYRIVGQGSDAALELDPTGPWFIS